MTSDTSTSFPTRQVQWLARRRRIAAAFLCGASCRQLAEVEQCAPSFVTHITSRELTPEQLTARWEARWQWKENWKRTHPRPKRDQRADRDRKRPTRPEWIPRERVREMLEAITLDEAVGWPLDQIAAKMCRIRDVPMPSEGA